MTLPRIVMLTLEEALEILKDHGWNVGRPFMEAALQQKVFDFGVCVEMKTHRFLISKAKLMRFIEENTFDESVDESVAYFIEHLEQEELKNVR